jgi:FAD:protein FMN transferase
MRKAGTKGQRDKGTKGGDPARNGALTRIAHFVKKRRTQQTISLCPFVPLSLCPFLLFLLLLTGCSEQEFLFSGKTMGTTYAVRVVARQEPDELGGKIDARLGRINAAMSTYRSASEISRFNRWSDPTEPFPISEDFMKIMVVARQLHGLTRGAWDGTIDPLVTLWGFGRDPAVSDLPEEADIQERLKSVGFDKIAVTEDGALLKTDPDLSLDFASIAKGYGVDQVAELVAGEGFRDFLVEIGGEVFASGTTREGRPWTVGINRPESAAAADAVYLSLPLRDQAMATSGDYRIFFEKDGKRYAHILDPRTGWPVANGAVSVSIIADACTFADGLATAVMVMGAPAGMALIEELADVEGIVIVRGDDGDLHPRFSSGLRPEN